MGKFLVALDDGHGLETAGKRTVELKEDIVFNGKIRKKGTIIHENEFNEVIMKKVEPHLKRCGIDYIELAPTDKDISLNKRIDTANKNKCDIVISIHANALTGDKWQTKAYGLVVIKTIKCSSNTDRLADIAYKYLKKVDFPGDGETKYGIRYDKDISGFTLAILRQTNMPAILVELGFMDNWNDVKIMCSEKFQNECAEALAKTICEYFKIDFKEEVIEVIKKKLVKNISKEEINIREAADWNSRIINKLGPGDSLTYIEKVDAKNGITDMYKTKAGYVTASNNYVKIIEV